MTEDLRPFTLDELARRWKCSRETLRQRCVNGEIPHFRIPGSAGYRIRFDTVMEIEESWEKPKSPSDASGEDTASHGGKPESDGAISLRHARERKPRPKPESYTRNTPRARPRG